MSLLSERIRHTLRLDPVYWAANCGVTLRPYQREIALAIKDSILHHRGLSFVVVLPRQSGKNELQAHLFSWLLFRYAKHGGNIVSVSPTFKPQTVNNMLKVKQKSLDLCLGSRGIWRSSKGYIYTLGLANLLFFSGEPRANVVGATADLLLSVDEAQQVSITKFDKDFNPMTASTNATRVFWGTAWTSDTLLERERRTALRQQGEDGLPRVFYYTAEDVRLHVPAYGRHVDSVIARNGRNHPLIRTQYFCETLDAQSGMFNPSRLMLMFGNAFPLSKSRGFGEGAPTEGSGREGLGLDSPSPNSQNTASALPPFSSSQTEAAAIASALPPFSYSQMGGAGGGHAFLLDIAGQDESKLNSLNFDTGLGNPGRDSTTLTIVSIDLSSLELLQKPTYHVVARHAWTGESHVTIFGKLKALAEQWNPQKIIIDATGVGEGLWAMLDRQFPSRVIPVKFTQQEKSEIGWRFLSIIETGRFRGGSCLPFAKHPPGAPNDSTNSFSPSPNSQNLGRGGVGPGSDAVLLQYSKCISEILPGPAKTLRWGVPDGTRAPDGSLIHDDYILADSLVAVLDRLEWSLRFDSFIINYPDPDIFAQSNY